MNAENITEDVLASVQQLIQDVGRTIPVTKKAYEDLPSDFASNLQAVRRGAEATTHDLADCEAKVSKLELNFQLLVEETGLAGDLQKRLDAKVGEFESANRALGSTKSASMENSLGNGCLEVDQGAARAAIGR